jgi:hypothetical protein
VIGDNIEAWEHVDVVIDRAYGRDRHWQRLERAPCRIDSLLNWCVTPRMGADILVEAMPDVVARRLADLKLAGGEVRSRCQDCRLDIFLLGTS